MRGVCVVCAQLPLVKRSVTSKRTSIETRGRSGASSSRRPSRSSPQSVSLPTTCQPIDHLWPRYGYNQQTQRHSVFGPVVGAAPPLHETPRLHSPVLPQDLTAGQLTLVAAITLTSRGACCEPFLVYSFSILTQLHYGPISTAGGTLHSYFILIFILSSATHWSQLQVRSKDIY